MQSRDWNSVTPDLVLDFWFPEDGHETDFDAHRAFWVWRMRGEADDAIRERFGDLTEAAAKGLLDHWAVTPRGHLALVIALDQFSRSVWRGTPAAFAQDIRAAKLVLDGLKNGHYAALPNVWEKAFCLIANAHCEGPRSPGAAGAQHAPRQGACRRGTRAPAWKLPHGGGPEPARPRHRREVQDDTHIEMPFWDGSPHSTEEAYIAAGEFPHERKIPSMKEEVEQLLAAREGSSD